MLSKIKVSHKLLLIYALDMITVVFLGFSLAEEKYIAINFARKEMVGLDYIATVRDTLFVALDRETDPARRAEQVGALRSAEERLGDGMDSAESAAAAMAALESGADPSRSITALRTLISRVGDMSNLILDPDLDSYYAMSLTLLRFPELAESLWLLRGAVDEAASAGPLTERRRAELAVLTGRLAGVMKGIEDDLAAGYRGNPDGTMRRTLAPEFAPLVEHAHALGQTTATVLTTEAPSAEAFDAVAVSVAAVLADSQRAWVGVAEELNRLLVQRIDGFFFRMYEHFAMAGGLLVMVLVAVLVLARRISRPIAHLAQVADTVWVENDYTLRAKWESGDEIGRLVIAFNTMLERLQAEGLRRQEMAAQARAAEAQRELIEAISTPLVVVRLADRAVVHVNEPALGLLGADRSGQWLDPGDLDRLLAALGEQGEVNGFEAECRGVGGETFWALISARRLVFLNDPAVLVLVTSIDERRRMEQELREAKTRAEKALQDLREAQHSLIQAEKLASLGGLVAGVAHEINTPVGIGLTGASTLAVETEKIHKLYQADDMGQQDFEDYLDVAARSARLLLSNMERAAALIQSFKQVAVDQVSDERRRFDLGVYISEVLTSLQPALRKTDVAVNVACPAGLEIDGYPGGLSQVLTNLVLNALTHAFDGRTNGTIHIRVDQPSADLVRLSVGDDGRGIPTSNLGRIFDPFFTTRRLAGGSGLGLHIVYNIVTRTLRGSIDVESEDGVGTTFSIVFPRVAETPNDRDAA